MGKFIERPPSIEAYQWFQNGDHPEDGSLSNEGKVVRYFRDPDISGNKICVDCKKTMFYHGWIDNPNSFTLVICPGDWIVKEPQTTGYYKLSDFQLKKKYQPLIEESNERN